MILVILRMKFLGVALLKFLRVEVRVELALRLVMFIVVLRLFLVVCLKGLGTNVVGLTLFVIRQALRFVFIGIRLLWRLVLLLFNLIWMLLLLFGIRLEINRW